MILQIGDSSFTVTLESSEVVDALVNMMNDAPIMIQMSDYSSFEKVGPLGTSLPTSNKQTTTQSGDIVLYNGNQIVIFYGSNSWSYTRLGKIDDSCYCINRSSVIENLKEVSAHLNLSVCPILLSGSAGTYDNYSAHQQKRNRKSLPCHRINIKIL